jgi:hypothetical protein
MFNVIPPRPLVSLGALAAAALASALLTCLTAKRPITVVANFKECTGPGPAKDRGIHVVR